MKSQKGIAHIGALLVVIVIVIIGAAGYAVSKAGDKNNKSNTGSNADTKDSGKIKSIGINLDYYNPDTGMAGDVQFVRDKFKSDMDLIFSEYGFQIAANSAAAARRNPQPTFIVPLGTKIRSLVDGEVVNIPKLYSNDYSVHVQPKGSSLIFETEHVKNVKVKVGDKVNAGQEIAEASDYDARNYAGLGLYEIGVLSPGNPPKHTCTFDYLDDSIREDILAKITALKKSWEEFRGNPNLYDESMVVIPGCLTRDPIEG